MTAFATPATRALLVFSILALTVLTVARQVERLHPDFLRSVQMERHNAVLQGTAPNPLQYRPLSEWLVEAAYRAVKALHLPRPDHVAFLGFRTVQNVLILLLAAGLYGRLTRYWLASLVGLSLLAFSMTQATYQSDLSFNTYTDLAAYLAAALLIWYRRPLWLLPLMVVAALNRETSGLIPFMLLLSAPFLAPSRPARLRLYGIAAAAFLIYLVVTVGLHWYYGPRPDFHAFGHPAGLDLLSYNLHRRRMWLEMLGTFGVVPFLAALLWRRWPPVLRACFWAVVPVWFLVHPLLAYLSETRYMLVPQAVIFIPGLLVGLAAPPEVAPPSAGGLP
jgi:hypothetical protein